MNLVTPQHEYKSKTMTSMKDIRRLYLPYFPMEYFNSKGPLLLANVSATHLTLNELHRRQSGVYNISEYVMVRNAGFTPRFDLILTNDDVQDLAQRLRVDQSIISFNLIRLDKHSNLIYRSYRYYQKYTLGTTRDLPIDEITFNSRQLSVMLEFFLQMDVDLFYMKTCSFRGALPRSRTEGLFCGLAEPEARYSIQPCRKQICSCCHPINQSKKSQSWPVVDFTSSSTHRFSNGYTTYLNCPATCDTTNIIYVMTCPCGEYEYVNSTLGSLAEAITHHREMGNRLVHEKLTGSRLYCGLFDPSETQRDISAKQRVYQHSAKCPHALRAFLDCNPDYWCFIPLRRRQAEKENQTLRRRTRQEPDDIYNFVACLNNAAYQQVSDFCHNVPLPPAAADFSSRQVNEQREFFHNFLSLPMNQAPYLSTDLYQYNIIALLPDNGNIVQRTVIETLFAIHGHTKLNMVCVETSDPQLQYGYPYQLDWCHQLKQAIETDV